MNGRGSLRLDKGATIRFVICIIILGIALVFLKRYLDGRYVVGCLEKDRQTLDELADLYNASDPGMKIVVKQVRDDGKFRGCDGIFITDQTVGHVTSQVNNQKKTDSKFVLKDFDTVYSENRFHDATFYPISVVANHAFVLRDETEDKGLTSRVEAPQSIVSLFSTKTLDERPLIALSDTYGMEEFLTDLSDLIYRYTTDTGSSGSLGILSEIYYNLSFYLEERPPITYDGDDKINTGFLSGDYSVMLGKSHRIAELLKENPGASVDMFTFCGDGISYDLPVHVSAAIVPLKKKDKKVREVFLYLYSQDFQKKYAEKAYVLPAIKGVECSDEWILNNVYDIIQSVSCFYHNTDRMGDKEIADYQSTLDGFYAVMGETGDVDEDRAAEQEKLVSDLNEKMRKGE